MLARPIQLVSQLSGASAEQVDKFTKDKFGDWIAPTPKTSGDVFKDVGRGIQTGLTAGIGGAVKAGITGTKTIGQVATRTGVEGAGFGLGMSMEEGNKILSRDTAKNVVFGAGIGAAAPLALRGVSKLIKKEPLIGKIITDEASSLNAAKRAGDFTVPEAGTPPPKLLGSPRPSSIQLDAEGILRSQQKLRQGVPSPEQPIKSSLKAGSKLSLAQQAAKSAGSVEDVAKAVTPETELSVKGSINKEASRVADIIDENLPSDFDKGSQQAVFERQARVEQEASVLLEANQDAQRVFDLGLGYRTDYTPGTSPTAYWAVAVNQAEKSNNIAMQIALSKSSPVRSIAGQSMNAIKIAEKGNTTNILSDINSARLNNLPSSIKRQIKKETARLADDLSKRLSNVEVRPLKKGAIRNILELIKCKK